MIVVYLFVLVVIPRTVWPQVATTPYINHLANYVNLVSAYFSNGHSTIDFLPLQDHSSIMNVDVSISLFAINGFDEIAGNIELVGALEMVWIDQTPTIHSINFEIQGRNSFMVPYDKIWTPKLVLTNAIGDTSEVGSDAYLCRFNMVDYSVNWRPRTVISASCSPDVTYYPFDRQACDFIFAAWGFSDTELLITSQQESWDVAEFEESGEWDVQSHVVSTYISNNQSFIKFTIGITRKPLYFAFNILIPVLVLCLLNSTVFLLPAESGERVGFSVTCFLSFVVLLNMIMDIMPRSSNPISSLCYYLVVMMCTSGGMTLVTILMMRVYHKPEKEDVPKWLQRLITFINCGCARIRCCVLCCRWFKRQCSCKDKRWCRCKNPSKTKLKKVTVEEPQTRKTKSEFPKSESEDTPEPKESDHSDNKEHDHCIGCFGLKRKCHQCTDKTADVEEEPVLQEQTAGELSENVTKCFSFLKTGKVSGNVESDNQTDQGLTIPLNNAGNADEGKTMKKKFSKLSQSSATTEGTLAAIRLNAWIDSTDTLTGKKGNTLDPIEDQTSKTDPSLSQFKEHEIDLPGTNDASDGQEDDNQASKGTNNNTPRLSRKRSSRLSSAKSIIRRNSTTSKKPDMKRRKSMDARHLLRLKLLDEHPSDPTNTSQLQRRASNPVESIRRNTIATSSESIKKLLEAVLDDAEDSESDKDSLADLEAEVTWPEVGRVFDTFFLLAFTAGEAFFTVVFLVPLFTANS